MQNLSYGNEFDLHENELVGDTHFHENGFAFKRVLAQRQTITRKLAIGGWLLLCGMAGPSVVPIYFDEHAIY